LVADGIGVRHPAFDVTPARLVDDVFTELGSFSPKNGGRPADLLKR
jgi:methylthioribose-1-phosphate isomerase